MFAQLQEQPPQTCPRPSPSWETPGAPPVTRRGPWSCSPRDTSCRSCKSKVFVCPFSLNSFLFSEIVTVSSSTKPGSKPALF